MKYACILVCVLLYCTNILAQEQKKHRKTVRNTERPLPKPQFAEPNTTSSPTMTSAITPNIQAIADSIAIANRFWSANDSLNLRLSQPIPVQAMSLSTTPATDYNRGGQLGRWQGVDFYGQSYRETFPAMLVRQGAQLGLSRSWDNLSLSVYASADRYRTFHTATQFGIGGSLTYRFSAQL